MPWRNIDHFLKKKKTHILKIRIFWNEQTFFILFPIFDLCENVNLYLYILFLVDKSMT